MTNNDNDIPHTKNWRESKKLLVVVVATALFLDNMLVSIVVPIIPQYIREIQKIENRNTENFKSTNLTSLNRKNKEFNQTYDIINSTTIFQQNQIEENTCDTIEQSTDIGFFLGMKTFAELHVNFFAGFLTTKFGYTKPMFLGFVIMFASTLCLALGKSYSVLMIARAIQGLGSSCTKVAGLIALTERFTIDKERETAMKTAIGAIAMGVMVGSPFGGITYFFEKSLPFYLLCGFVLIDGILQLFMKQPKYIKKNTEKTVSLLTLLRDPYILIVMGGLLLQCCEFALLEVVLPLWMLDKMNATSWESGIIFLPILVSAMLTWNILIRHFPNAKRWLLLTFGFILMSICTLLFQLCQNVNHIIGLNAILGFTIGISNAAIMPELVHLLNIRYTAGYNKAYEVADLAICVGLTIGAFGGGLSMNRLGFKWTMTISAIISFLYSLLPCFLNNPPVKNEKMITVEKKSKIQLMKKNEDTEDNQ